MEILATAYLTALAGIVEETGGDVEEELREPLEYARGRYGNSVRIDNETSPVHVKGKVAYPTKEIPDRYKKGLHLNPVYRLGVEAGNFGPDDKGAGYYRMSKGSPSSMFFNLDTLLPQLNSDSLGKYVQHLQWLESAAKHEIQHMTQDAILRRQHPKQMEEPSGNIDDEYYTSDLEFHPSITTAGEYFKEALALVKGTGRQVNDKTYKDLLTAFVNPDAGMPEGFARYRKNFSSEFFSALRRSDPQKWKKAVKELHRLLSS